MELNEIEELMDKFEKSNICEFNLDEYDFSLYLSKNSSSTIKTKKDKFTSSDKDNKIVTVKSPSVGVVYLRSQQNKKPYVQVGDSIKKGDVIAIIEAMKMITEIKSTTSGVVAAINVKDEDLVEVGQSLITVKK